MTFERIELQDHLRQNARDSEQDNKRLQQLSESLNAQFLVLQTLRQCVPGISGDFNEITEDTQPHAFDGLDEEDLMICELNAVPIPSMLAVAHMASSH